MAEQSNKISYITGIKTVCILLVCLWHCVLFYVDEPFFPENFNSPSPGAAFVGNVFDVTLMASFVFCAGFVYARSLECHNRTIPQRIWERIKRLIIPYYIIGALWLVPLYTLFDIKTYGRPDGAGLAEGYVHMALGQFSDHLWFLWMLFWVALFFILSSFLFRKNLKILLLVITIAAAVCVKLFLYDFPYFKLSQIAPYLICYYAGMFCYGIRDRLEQLSAGVRLTLAGALFAAVIAHAIFLPSHFLWLYIARLCGALFFFFLFMYLEETQIWKCVTGTAVYDWIARHQLEMYSLHMPLPYLFARILRPYIGGIPILCILINYALVLLCGMMIVQIYIRIMSCITRLLGQEQ